jgi:hypothetical protein
LNIFKGKLNGESIVDAVGLYVPTQLIAGFPILPVSNIPGARCDNTTNSVGQFLDYFPYFEEMKGFLVDIRPISLSTVCPSSYCET